MDKKTLLFIGVVFIGALYMLSKTETGKAIINSVTNLGINLIRYLEGLRLDVYKDEAGIYTVGYGHKVLPHDDLFPNTNKKSITEEEAINFLKQDLQIAENAVNKYVTVPLNEQQFNSLVSFIFNVGVSAFSGSTLLKKLNSGDYIGAANEFDRWVYANKNVSNILVSRRATEKTMFLTV
jgi:lysozyme